MQISGDFLQFETNQSLAVEHGSLGDLIPRLTVVADLGVDGHLDISKIALSLWWVADDPGYFKLNGIQAFVEVEIMVNVGKVFAD